MTPNEQVQLNALMRAVHVARQAQKYFDDFLVPNRNAFDLGQQVMFVNDLDKDKRRVYDYAEMFMPRLGTDLINAMTIEEIVVESAVYFLPEYNPPESIEALREKMR